MRNKKEQEYTTAQRRRKAAERYAEELKRAEALKNEDNAQNDVGNTIVRIKSETEGENQKGKSMSPKKKKTIIISVISGALALLLVAGILINVFVKKEMFGGYDESAYGEVVLDEEMKGVYTCLLVATDKSKSNTDTIMLAVMRYKDDVKRIDLISIPRDTRVMNPIGKGGYVKINSIMARNGGKINALVTEVRNITGIPINDFMLVDIEAVKKSVDMFGGVMFDVPMDMHYEDGWQELYIHLDKGMQLIDGKKAEQLLRFRAGYADADLGRTKVQREFMVEAFKQHAKPSNLGKIGKWYAEMDGYVQTQITYEKAYKYGLVVTTGEFEMEQRILPGTVITGSPDYFYDAEKINEMAKELGFDGDVVSTPRPNINKDSGDSFGKEEGPASTILEEVPAETVVPTAPGSVSDNEDDEDSDDDDEDDERRPSSSNKPVKTEKPDKTHSGTSSSKPTSSASAKPGATHNNDRDGTSGSSDGEHSSNSSGHSTSKPSSSPSGSNKNPISTPNRDDNDGYPDGI